MPRERFPTHSVPVSQTLEEQLFPPSTLRLDCLTLLEDASLILTDYFRKWTEFSNILAERSDWSLVSLPMPRERFPTHSVPVSQTLEEQLFPLSTLRLDCLTLLEDASLILTDYFRKWPEFSNILAERSDWSLVYL